MSVLFFVVGVYTPSREDILNIVAHDSQALGWLPDELRADRQIVLKAVGNDGDALQHASPQLQGDRQI
eukprot:2853771-Amphidinium_carterae.1